MTEKEAITAIQTWEYPLRKAYAHNDFAMEFIEGAVVLRRTVEKIGDWITTDEAIVIAELVHRYGVEAVAEACEKQIPKKPRKHIVQPDEDIKILNGKWGKGTTIYKCECGCWLRRGLKYCFECGQRIDFSEEGDTE